MSIIDSMHVTGSALIEQENKLYAPLEQLCERALSVRFENTPTLTNWIQQAKVFGITSIASSLGAGIGAYLGEIGYGDTGESWGGAFGTIVPFYAGYPLAHSIVNNQKLPNFEEYTKAAAPIISVGYPMEAAYIPAYKAIHESGLFNNLSTLQEGFAVNVVTGLLFTVALSGGMQRLHTVTEQLNQKLASKVITANILEALTNHVDKLPAYADMVRSVF